MISLPSRVTGFFAGPGTLFAVLLVNEVSLMRLVSAHFVRTTGTINNSVHEPRKRLLANVPDCRASSVNGVVNHSRMKCLIHSLESSGTRGAGHKKGA